MPLIQLDSVHRFFGAKEVLSGITWEIDPRRRIGLIGRNGCGKTTLFHLLAGREKPDRGAVHRQKNLRVAFLPQEPQLVGESTVKRSALAGFHDLLALQNRLAELEGLLANGESSSRILDEYGQLHDRYEREDGYSMEARAEAILQGLGFEKGDLEKQVHLLSGGQRNRLALAQLLAREPAVLLLDEPTNHLDLSAVEWLEGYLATYEGSFIAVSHDRYFLDRAVTEMVELHDGKLDRYTGGFSYFVVERERRRAAARKEFDAQQAYVRKAEEFIRKNIAGQKTKQAQSRRRTLEKLGRVDRPRDPREMALGFSPGSRGGNRVFEAQGLDKSFGEETLFKGLDLLVSRQDRLGIIGPNGSGKTTLLRIITGEMKADAGSAKVGAGIEVGYYDQNREDLNHRNSVLEELWSVTPQSLVGEIRKVLGAFLFSGDDVEQKVGTLSGGEQARLALAKLLRKRVNFLVLDEPTNHLDIQSRMVLEDALDSYSGTLVTVSHDRYFLNRIATRLLVIEDGSWTVFEGNYNQWRQRKKEAIPVVRENPEKLERKSGYEKSRRSKREEQRRERRRTELEEEIGRLESSLDQLKGQMKAKDISSDWDHLEELSKEKDEIQTRIEDRMREWEALEVEEA